MTKTIFPDRFQFIAILRIFPRISKKIQILQNPIYQGKIIVFDVLDMQNIDFLHKTLFLEVLKFFKNHEKFLKKS